MHKGYTLNYFINFFQSIPTSRWTCGSLLNVKENNKNKSCALKACALGFAGAYKLVEEEVTRYREDGTSYTVTQFAESEATTPAREYALEDFLDNDTASINDETSKANYGKLGKTPRARILKALKLRKKHGPDWKVKSKLFT